MQDTSLVACTMHQDPSSTPPCPQEATISIKAEPVRQSAKRSKALKNLRAPARLHGVCANLRLPIGSYSQGTRDPGILGNQG